MNASTVMSEARTSVSSPGRIPYLLVAFLLTALALSPFVALLGYEAYFIHRIHLGVDVGGITLGGLDLTEAQNVLQREFAGFGEGNLTLRDGERTWMASLRELGVVYDPVQTGKRAFGIGRQGTLLDQLEAQVNVANAGRSVAAARSFDEGVATVYLSRLARDVNRPARDATLQVHGMQVVVEPAQGGRELDIEATKDRLKAAIESLAQEPVDLVVREVVPTVTDVEAARKQALQVLSTPIILTFREQNIISGTLDAQVVEKRWSLDPASLASMFAMRQVRQPGGGVGLDVKLDVQKLRPYIEKLAVQIDRPARDARFDFDPKSGRLTPLVTSQEGYTVDITGTVDLVNEKISSTDRTLRLPVQVKRPAVAVENAAQMGIKELVAEATTNFKGSSAARIHNVQLAATRFDGVVIAPGQLFSFNEYLGEVSAATGYEEGQIIWGDRTATGLGGGVCQVSSTAFRAAFWAGLPVLERHNHGYRVQWYEPPVGLDATVYAPAVDFKFKNDMKNYILIKTETDVKNFKVTFRFYGTSEGRVVEMSGPEEKNPVKAGPARYQDDPKLPAGTQKQVEWAHDGSDVTVRRIVREGARVVLEDTFFSRYEPWPAMFLRGTKGTS